jgi:ABC-type siderophore export system, fused ATPase and permease components
MLLKSNVYSIIFEYGILFQFFYLPLMGVIQPDALMAVITLILLIPFGYIKNNIPFLVRGVVSIERLIMLENTLIQFNKEKPADIKAPEIKLFKEIQYSQICYHYQENTDFSLENISFCVYPNEIIFIRGGNGSGKTTLLKVITGLYHPGSGMVSIDGKR